MKRRKKKKKERSINRKKRRRRKRERIKKKTRMGGSEGRSCRCKHFSFFTTDNLLSFYSIHLNVFPRRDGDGERG